MKGSQLELVGRTLDINLAERTELGRRSTATENLIGKIQHFPPRKQTEHPFVSLRPWYAVERKKGKVLKLKNGPAQVLEPEHAGLESRGNERIGCRMNIKPGVRFPDVVEKSHITPSMTPHGTHNTLIPISEWVGRAQGRVPPNKRVGMNMKMNITEKRRRFKWSSVRDRLIRKGSSSLCQVAVTWGIKPRWALGPDRSSWLCRAATATSGNYASVAGELLFADGAL